MKKRFVIPTYELSSWLWGLADEWGNLPGLRDMAKQSYLSKTAVQRRIYRMRDEGQIIKRTKRIDGFGMWVIKR